MYSIGKETNKLHYSRFNDEDSGVFMINKEAIQMKSWQILEFDGIPFYAFVPENVIPLEDSEEIVVDQAFYTQEEEEEEEDKVQDSLLNSDAEYPFNNKYIEEDQTSNSEIFEFEGMENIEEEDESQKSATSIEETIAHEEEVSYDNFIHVEVNDDQVIIQKLDMELSETVEAESETIEMEEEEEEEDEEEVDDPTEDGNNVESSFKCKSCSETLPTKMAFRKHVALKHRKVVFVKEGDTFFCSICDYSTTKKTLFVAHVQRMHEKFAGQKKSGKNIFPCSACGFECRSKHSLQSHFTRKHTDSFEYQCNVCPKKFKVKGDLTNHIRFHHKEQPVKCDVCDKLCMNSGSLYVHKKWAHDKPKFECPICKRRMVTQENLDQHIISQHEKRENVVCEECGKSFTKKDSFKRHMSVHTGSKPHACVICKKNFARRSQLRQHLLIHTGKRPFACDLCDKSFSQKPGLICHRKTHPGTHPPLPVMPIGDIVKEFTDKIAEEMEILGQ